LACSARLMMTIPTSSRGMYREPPDTGKARQQAFERAALAPLLPAARSGYCGG
jgi:hypothetical protein